jgi:hypothetical protein
MRGLGVWRCQSFATSWWLFLQDVSPASLQDFTLGSTLSVSSLWLSSWNLLLLPTPWPSFIHFSFCQSLYPFHVFCLSILFFLFSLSLVHHNNSLELILFTDLLILPLTQSLFPSLLIMVYLGIVVLAWTSAMMELPSLCGSSIFPWW